MALNTSSQVQMCPGAAWKWAVGRSPQKSSVYFRQLAQGNESQRDQSHGSSSFSVFSVCVAVRIGWARATAHRLLRSVSRAEAESCSVAAVPQTEFISLSQGAQIYQSGKCSCVLACRKAQWFSG